MKQKTKTEKTAAVTFGAARQTKRYDPAFKQAAVANWIKTGQSGTQLAAELGIRYPSLKEWKRRYSGDAGPQRDDLATENRALKAELARVPRATGHSKKNAGPRHRTIAQRYATIASMNAEASQRERAAAALRMKIRAVHQQPQGRYGAPRIQRELAAQGDRHGCKRIARLMRADRLQGLCARRFVPRTTPSDHDHPLAPNRLAERPAPTGPNQTWVTDLT